MPFILFQQLYKKLNIHVALIGMEIWNDKDKIKISPNASLTLESFAKWRGGVLLRRKRHDVAQLITYVEIFPFVRSVVFAIDVFQSLGKANGISGYRFTHRALKV